MHYVICTLDILLDEKITFYYGCAWIKKGARMRPWSIYFFCSWESTATVIAKLLLSLMPLKDIATNAVFSTYIFYIAFLSRFVSWHNIYSIIQHFSFIVWLSYNMENYSPSNWLPFLVISCWKTVIEGFFIRGNIDFVPRDKQKRLFKNERQSLLTEHMIVTTNWETIFSLWFCFLIGFVNNSFK